MLRQRQQHGHIYTTRWLVGENPVEVSAHTWTRDTVRFRDVEKGISFRLRFPSGLIVHGSSTYGAALSSFIYIQGTQGWVCLTPAFPFDEERRLSGKIGGRALERKFKVIDEFSLELDAFAAAIQEKRALEQDGAQGHRDMIILEAIYESARIRQPVAIRDSPRVERQGA